MAAPKPGRACTNCGRETPRKNMLCSECADAYRHFQEWARKGWDRTAKPPEITVFTLPEGWTH
jgi:predicted amidophosphoribosyltransferase